MITFIATCNCGKFGCFSHLAQGGKIRECRSRVEGHWFDWDPGRDGFTSHTAVTGHRGAQNMDIHRTSQLISSSLYSLLQLSFHRLHHVKRVCVTPQSSPILCRLHRDSHSIGGAFWMHPGPVLTPIPCPLTEGLEQGTAGGLHMCDGNRRFGRSCSTQTQPLNK